MHRLRCKACNSPFMRVRRDASYCSYNCLPSAKIKTINDRPTRCEICNGEEKFKSKFGKLHRMSMDHDHKTGNRRGFLCSHCNHGIGAFRDNTEILAKAIIYLTKYKIPKETPEHVTPTPA